MIRFLQKRQIPTRSPKMIQIQAARQCQQMQARPTRISNTRIPHMRLPSPRKPTSSHPRKRLLPGKKNSCRSGCRKCLSGLLPVKGKNRFSPNMRIRVPLPCCFQCGTGWSLFLPFRFPELFPSRQGSRLSSMRIFLLPTTLFFLQRRRLFRHWSLLRKALTF